MTGVMALVLVLMLALVLVLMLALLPTTSHPPPPSLPLHTLHIRWYYQAVLSETSTDCPEG